MTPQQGILIQELSLSDSEILHFLHSDGMSSTFSTVSVMCGRRCLGKNFLMLLQHWSGAVMCAANVAAGHNAIRGSGPNRKHAFKDG